MFVNKIILNKHPLINDVEVYFSLPVEQKEGSGLNFVVGSSGAGKTKFLPSFLPTSQHPGTANWRSNYRIEGSRYNVVVVDEDSKEIPLVNGTLRIQNFKEINPDGVRKFEKDYLFESEEFSEENHLGRFEKKLRSQNRFNDVYPKIFNNSGSGEARFNILMWQLEEFESSDKFQIALMEEPETFLDPNNQLKVLEILGRIGMKKQLFISTHSPYLISWDYLQNGATIIKTNKENNAATIGRFCNPKIVMKINNPGQRNPQLNGVETKNIFFSNKVFVVEGQEDVGLITNYLNKKKYDFTFFGYGAGSSSKIENVLELCYDLKIPKVAALFDNSPNDNNKHYEECKKKFPVYKMEKLLADDIRDKYDKEKIIRKGAYEFNPNSEKCTLKVDELGKDFEIKLNAIFDYLNSTISIPEMKFSLPKSGFNALPTLPEGIKKAILENNKDKLIKTDIETIVRKLMSDKFSFQLVSDISKIIRIHENKILHVMETLNEMGFAEKKVEEDGKDYYRVVEHPIRIYSASYGIEGNYKDVTDKIKSLKSPDGTYKGKASHLVFGINDPKHGVKKDLKIHCRIHGQEMELFFQEDEDFILE